MKKYEPFAKAGATLVRASLKITSLVLDSNEAKKWWRENSPITTIRPDGTKTHKSSPNESSSFVFLVNPSYPEPHYGDRSDPDRWKEHILCLIQSRLPSEDRESLISRIEKLQPSE